MLHNVFRCKCNENVTSVIELNLGIKLYFSTFELLSVSWEISFTSNCYFEVEVVLQVIKPVVKNLVFDFELVTPSWKIKKLTLSY